LLAIATDVIEGEADEGIFVAEAEAVELRGSEGSSVGEFELGVAVGISVAVAETVELTVSEGSSEPAGLAVGDARPL
jgi:hypothetical protein